MVHREQQYVILVCQPAQKSTQQRTLAEIKGTPDLLSDSANGFSVSLALQKPAEVDEFEPRCRGSMNHLEWLSVPTGKGCSQRLVASNNLFETALQSMHNKLASQSKSSRYVVHIAVRFELLQ